MTHEERAFSFARGITLACLFVVFVFFFYKEATGEFVSDLVTHLEHALDLSSSSYTLMSAMLWVGYAAAGHVGVALLLALICIATIVGTEHLFKVLLPSTRSSAIFVFAVLCNFATGIYVPYAIGANVSTANGVAWHNATFLGMRLFALCATIYFLRIYPSLQRDSKATWRDWMLFALFTALATAIKPSFIVVFGPAVFVLCICDCAKEGRQSLRKSLLIGACLLASVGVVAFQYMVLYVHSSSGNGIGIGFAVVLSHRHFNLALYLLQSFAFPLLVLAGNIGAMEKRHYSLAWLMLAFALAEYLIFYETGSRIYHGNFAWSLKYATFYLFISSIAVLLSRERAIPACLLASTHNATKSIPAHDSQRLLCQRISTLYSVACLALFGCSALFGIFFFVRCCMGVPYGAVWGAQPTLTEADFWPFVFGGP